MEKTIKETRELPVKEEFDLIVCGGGIAGIAAALAGVRQGMKTMLIEKSTMLGGLATLGLINWYEPVCDGEGRLMNTGIAEELLLLSALHGYSSMGEQWKARFQNKSPDFKPANKTPRYDNRFNPMVYALLLNELTIKEGIELRYDMIASYPVMEGKICKGIITESTSGREFFPCKVVVDATGDADIASRAGIPCRFGSNYLSYWGSGCTVSSIEKTLKIKDMIALNDSFFKFGSDMNGKGHPEKYPFITGLTNEERSEYIRQGQNGLLNKIKTKPENENCLYTLPGMIQLRMTRCIIGRDTFKTIDGNHYETSIGAASDFRNTGRHYEFPFGILFNDDYPNLLAAGRVVSAEGDGWEMTRPIPSAALTGEAAGIAASLMAKQQKGAPELKVKEVQTLLEKNNVILHFTNK